MDTSADDVALIAFTSGTTGRPKGCMHFHRDVLAIADTFARHVLKPTPDDVFAGSPPLGFTFGLGGLVVFPLRAGASALLLEQAGPSQLLPALAEHRVSVLFTAPTAYRAMLEELDGYDLSALRRCVLGRREPSGGDLAGLAASAPACASSTASAPPNSCTSSSPRRTTTSGPAPPAGPCPAGRPASSTGTGEPVPDGEPGLLAVRGPVGCRYLADERQREYVRHGWNVTGDTYVRDSDGWFRYVARADDMIISAGFNIAGPEVEDALLRHPDVTEAAVVGRPDERRGHVVVAYCVLRPGVRARRGHRGAPARLREGRARPVQVPARDRLPGRAPAHPHRASSSASGCGN